MLGELRDPTTLWLFTAAAFGACSQELSWWYELRHKLHLKEYNRLLTSKGYWVLVVAMILASSVGTVLLHSGRLAAYTAADFMIFGAAFPLIFKQLTGNAARRARGGSRLGAGALLESYLLI